MKHRYKPIKDLLMLVLLANVSSHAYAQSSINVDFKPNLMWLSDDVNMAVFDESREYQSFVGKSEIWGDKWGVSASLLQNQDDIFGMPKDSKYVNLDVKRRFGNKNKSSFELGLGWQEFNIDSQLEASGIKLSLSGRVNLRESVQVYGLSSWLPELDDDLNSNADLSAYELEAGFLYNPAPSLSLKAGYRYFSLDLENDDLEDLGSSSGFLFGTDWNW